MEDKKTAEEVLYEVESYLNEEIEYYEKQMKVTSDRYPQVTQEGWHIDYLSGAIDGLKNSRGEVYNRLRELGKDKK